MNFEEFNKKNQEINNELMASLYNLPKKDIIQDEPIANIVAKCDKNFKNNTFLNFIDKCQINVGSLINQFLKRNKDFMNNNSTRNKVSFYCGLLVFIFSLSIINYCILTPFEKINYYFIAITIVLLVVLNYLYQSLYIFAYNVCPKCHENNALKTKEIKRECIGTHRETQTYEVVDISEYQITEREYCQYCGYYEDSTYTDTDEEFVNYTPAGFLKKQQEENERHEEEMLKRQREENERHEQAMYENKIKANDDLIRKQNEAWERRRRGY